MDFNYYSFSLNGKERIFYTSVSINPKEILDWAVRYNFIKESNVANCSNVKVLTPSEVKEKNKELYKKWWKKHRNDDSLSGKIPPTIGEAQLN